MADREEGTHTHAVVLPWAWAVGLGWDAHAAALPQCCHGVWAGRRSAVVPWGWGRDAHADSAMLPHARGETRSSFTRS